MSHCKKQQFLQLLPHLRRRAMTYGDMQALRISTCPWKRLDDQAHLLPEGEKLVKGTNKDGLVTWRVVKKKCEVAA